MTEDVLYQWGDGIYRWDGPVSWMIGGRRSGRAARLVAFEEQRKEMAERIRLAFSGPFEPPLPADLFMGGGAYANAQWMYDRMAASLFGHEKVWAEAYRATHAGWTFWRVYRDQYAVPPHMVVWDRKRVAMQIDMLLDPFLAKRAWVFDAFGVEVTPRQAEIIAAIHQGKVGLPSHWRSLPR